VSTSIFVQPLPSDSKQDWRRWAKNYRSQLVSPTLDYEIVKTLRSSELYQRSRHVLSYLAFGSEINLAALHGDSSKTFYVTRTWEDGTLRVHPLKGDLEVHPYGFLQPPATTPTVDLATIDLVLVPGLAFDKQGARLGYGKGYYDRLLPTLENAPRLGVSAHLLVVETLPREPHDALMTQLVSETGIYTITEPRMFEKL
jgi:5-formyltetrahydrofolate cyclo-ligase